LFKCPSCHKPAFTARQILVDGGVGGPLTCGHCGVLSHHSSDLRKTWVVGTPPLFMLAPGLLASRHEWTSWDWAGLAFGLTLAIALVFYIPLEPMQPGREVREEPEDTLGTRWPQTLWW
jgi:hypothetical protein